MAYTFRKSINGFHKDDVMAYIAHMNAQHEAKVSQLTSDLQAARSAAPDNEALTQRIRELETQLEQAAATAPKEEGWVEAELAAYRRAESAERHARERVAQLMDLANGLTADASLQLEQTAAHLDELTRQAQQAVAALGTALEESQGILQEVTRSISSLGTED